MWNKITTVATAVFLTFAALWVLSLMVWTSLMLLGIIDISHLYRGC